MTVEELKKLINLSSNDSIVYKRNGERVEPKIQTRLLVFQQLVTGMVLCNIMLN